LTTQYPRKLMWGVGPVTRARLAEIGVHTIGQLAKMPDYSLERLLGRAAGEKLTATLRHLADRVASRLRAKSRPGCHLVHTRQR